MSQPSHHHPSAESTRSSHLVAEVVSASRVVVDGTVHTVTAGADPYDAVYDQAQHAALSAGASVTVYGIDRVRDEHSWFTIFPDGTMSPATGPTTESTHEPTDGSAHTPDAGSATEPAEQPTSRAEIKQAVGGGRKMFVAQREQKPRSGVRRLLYTLSGGSMNLGPTAKERRHQELLDRVSRALQGSHNTAVLSLKGGIGKTSTTVGVGLTLAEHRGEPPCAIDANPDSGDLVERALGERAVLQDDPKTISDLLAELDQVTSLTQLQHFLQQAGRLHVLAGDQNPEVSDSFTAEEWRRIHQVFSQYYPVILTDCGTGVTHNAMKGILQTADNVVIAAGYAVSGAQRALQTLDWLNDHGYQHLARESVVVVTDKERVTDRVDRDAIRDSLRSRCRRFVVVPFDPAVGDGDQIDLELIRDETRQAYLEIASAVVDGYR